MHLSMNAPANMDRDNRMTYMLYCNDFGDVAASNVVLQARRVLPSIPHEREIDDLIAGCNSPIVTFLQIIKETVARAGEVFKFSSKLASMLGSIPKNGERIFSRYKSLRSLSCTFEKTAKELHTSLETRGF